MKIVGITELRRNLSDYIDLVENKKEIIKVTNRNVVIAKIMPIKNDEKNRLYSSK